MFKVARSAFWHVASGVAVYLGEYENARMVSADVIAEFGKPNAFTTLLQAGSALRRGTDNQAPERKAGMTIPAEMLHRRHSSVRSVNNHRAALNARSAIERRVAAAYYENGTLAIAKKLGL